MAPFDRALPSPIARVRELRARAPGAVVGVRGMTGLQQQAYVETAVEARLAALAAAADAPDLIVLSGSAGSGKSALIDRVERRHPGRFERVVQDATHSDSPSQTQADTLAEFFEPFANGSPAPRGRPRIIAANIGLLLQLFAQLRRHGDDRFSALEGVLKHRLGVARDDPPAVPWTAVVLNLDLRPTAGGEGLLRQMLALADFDNAEGVLEGAPRCSTCEVRAWCPVRTNAVLASRVAAPAIDALAERAATERGRHDAPRQLWDLTARLLTGDDPFDSDEDPCEAVAAAAARGDREWVWERLLPRKLFETAGDVGKRIAALDPSLRASAPAHRILTAAGIVPAADASCLAELDTGGAEALATAAEYLAAAGPPPAEIGRALVAASFIQDPAGWEIGDDVAAEFGAALAEYERFSRGGEGPFPALEGLRRLMERALARAFGVLEGDVPYVPVEAYDPRDPSRIFVHASLRYDDGTYDLLPDPAIARDRAGAELAGHRTLALTTTVGGVELTVNLPVYRLLRAAQAGTIASTADLERFYGLRRAVEALARTAASQRPELLVQRPGTSRRYTVRRTTGLGGQELVSVQEAGR